MKSHFISTLELRNQLLMLVFLIFIPVLAIMMYTSVRQYRHVMADIELNATHLIERFENEQLKVVKQTKHLLSIMAQVPSVQHLETPECNQFLKAIHQDSPQYTTLVAASPQGRILCCAIPLKRPIDVSDRSWFKRVSQRRQFIMDQFIISRSAKKASLPFAYPILDREKKNLIAVVGAAFNLESYNTLFKSIPLPENSVIFLTDRTDRIIYQSGENSHCLGKTVKQCRKVEFPDAPRGKVSVMDTDGIERIYWFNHFKARQNANESCLFIGIPKQVIFSRVRQALLTNFILLGLVAVLSLAIAWFFGGRFILDPVNRLLERTRRVQQGDLNLPESIGELPGELEILSRAFDDMVLTLSQRENDRKEAYAIITNSPLVVLTCRNEPGWPVEFVTGNIETVFGYPPDGFLNKVLPFARIIHPGDLERVRQEISDKIGKIGRGAFAHSPYRILTRSGAVRWVDARVTVKCDSSGEITHLNGILLDITERKQAEDAVHALRNYLSNIIDSMPSVLVGVDLKTRVTQWNRRAETMTQLSKERAKGGLFQEVFPMSQEEGSRVTHAIETAIARRQVVRDLKIPFHRGEDKGYEDITIFPLTGEGVRGAVIRIDDVTEKVRMEEILIQNEKMLSIGGLAAGMAHEINNPLAGVIQNASVLENRLTSHTIPANQKAAAEAGTTMASISQFMAARKIPRMIEAIKEAGSRMASIVENMLNFARKEEFSFSSHALEELMDKTLELAATDYDLKKQYDFKSILIQKEYKPDLPMVSCERGKIQQVFLNLLNNGAHAMLARVKTDPMPVPRFILRLSYLVEPNMVQIEIEDNGIGMTETIRKKIFDPFFTTKPVGVGTGLGLSISYFIITDNHRGSMDVVSEPGKGTSFIIRLPVIQGEPGGAGSEQIGTGSDTKV